MKLLALLPAGGFSKEGWLYSTLGWSVFVFHGEPYMVSLLTMLVTNIDHVVPSIIVGKMSGIVQFSLALSHILGTNLMARAQ